MKYRLTPENKHICIFWMPAQMPSILIVQSADNAAEVF